MHAQQAQDVPLNQMEVVNASPAIAAWQGTDTQRGAPEEKADTTGVENGTWSSDDLLVLLDLPYDGASSTTDTLDTPFGASGYQRTSLEAETNYKHAQPSNIQEVANPGEMSTRVVHPLATTTGFIWGRHYHCRPRYDYTPGKWWTSGHGYDWCHLWRRSQSGSAGS